jgi:hypothetical protein
MGRRFSTHFIPSDGNSLVEQDTVVLDERPPESAAPPQAHASMRQSVSDAGSAVVRHRASLFVGSQGKTRRDRGGMARVGRGRLVSQPDRRRDQGARKAKYHETGRRATLLATKGECLHPGAAKGECALRIARAHSVSRTWLDRIAEGGHVLSLDLSYFRQIQLLRGVPPIEQVGVNDASTFAAFCASHHHETFKPLETQPVEPTTQQALLLCYRALCLATYRIRRLIETLQADLTPISHDIPLQREAAWRKFREDQVRAKRLMLDDITTWKLMAEHVMSTAGWDDHVAYYAVRLSGRPVMLASSAHAPVRDFLGTRLQELPGAGTPEVVTFSLVPVDGGVVAVFAWLGENRPAARLIGSLRAMPNEALPDAILRFGVETSTENLFLRPSWWKGLSPPSRSSLLRRISRAERTGGLTPHLEEDGERIFPHQVASRSWQGV